MDLLGHLAASEDVFQALDRIILFKMFTNTASNLPLGSDRNVAISFGIPGISGSWRNSVTACTSSYTLSAGYYGSVTAYPFIGL
jgi:hypothetical protein